MRTWTPRRTKRGTGRVEFFRTQQSEIGSQADGAALSESFGQQTFVTVLTAFALGYSAALLFHRAR
jgi:hypothetical protein